MRIEAPRSETPVAELRPVRRFVRAGQSIFLARSIACQMLLGFAGGTHGFSCDDQGIPAVAHRLGREVRVHAGTVPITLHRLGFDAGVQAVLLGNPIQQVAGDPKMIADFDGTGRANLEFPLSGHDLGVGAADLEAGIDACSRMFFDQFATSNLGRTNAAVVRALAERGRPCAGSPPGQLSFMSVYSCSMPNHMSCAVAVRLGSRNRS